MFDLIRRMIADTMRSTAGLSTWFTHDRGGWPWKTDRPPELRFESIGVLGLHSRLHRLRLLGLRRLFRFGRRHRIAHDSPPSELPRQAAANLRSRNSECLLG